MINGFFNKYKLFDDSIKNKCILYFTNIIHAKNFTWKYNLYSYYIMSLPFIYISNNIILFNTNSMYIL